MKIPKGRYVMQARDRATRKYILLHEMLRQEVERDREHPAYREPWWLANG